MDPDAPKPLDYATPRADRTAPHPAALVVGILLLIVGGLIFFVGIGAIGLDFKTGSLPEGRAVGVAIAGATICWMGMSLKKSRRGTNGPGSF